MVGSKILSNLYPNQSWIFKSFSGALNQGDPVHPGFARQWHSLSAIAAPVPRHWARWFAHSILI